MRTHARIMLQLTCHICMLVKFLHIRVSSRAVLVTGLLCDNFLKYMNRVYRLLCQSREVHIVCTWVHTVCHTSILPNQRLIEITLHMYQRLVVWRVDVRNKANGMGNKRRALSNNTFSIICHFWSLHVSFHTFPKRFVILLVECKMAWFRMVPRLFRRLNLIHVVCI